jgi:hypothetical protein
LNPRPLGYEPRRHCSTPDIIWQAHPVFPGRTRLRTDHLPWPDGSKGLTTGRSLRARSVRVAREQDQSPGPSRGGQVAVDGGEWVASVQDLQSLRDLGGQQSRNVTSKWNGRWWHLPSMALGGCRVQVPSAALISADSGVPLWRHTACRRPPQSLGAS